MSTDTLLIEIGTEELPPKALRTLSEAFHKEILAACSDAQLIDTVQTDIAVPYASPRRLAISIPDVIAAQPDQVVERRGPAVQAAFKEDGSPTPAAQGFAKSCGVEVDQLQRMKTDKGEWLSYQLNEPGKTTADLIPGIIERAIKRLPIAKRMRWGAGNAEFVRPVKWLIVMHGNQLIPLELLGVKSGTTTQGHRFHCDSDISLSHADQYAEQLLQPGHVVASFSARQSLISAQIEKLAASINGHIEEDQALLDEVTGLVEQPTAVLGSFDADFLSVPQECLISSMRDHQKYFHLVDKNGKLLPNFITVSNIQSKDPARVIGGNERVLRARLSDARFFWETDQKIRLEERVARLENVLFHVKLGSVLDKSKRIQTLASRIADEIGGNTSMAERGAMLAKADLISEMVSEFDELQGIMGRYYADLDGEPAVIGECIEQHYWPRFAGDQLPDSKEAQAVSLADKLDSLVGIYGAGEVPTGDKDPFGLRRAALGILRLLIDKQHPLTLSTLVEMAANIYRDQQEIEIGADTQQEIVDFIRGRLTAYYQNQDIATSTINAVMACKPDSPLDFENRVKAVHQFEQLSEASDLAAANKRISNILKKQDSAPGKVDPAVLTEVAEQELHQAIESVAASSNKLFDAGNYADGLQQLAALRSPVDNFFEHVMVMSDDAKQRANRLALLGQLQQLFLRVADISLLQSQ